jgi:hypothetical protein
MGPKRLLVVLVFVSFALTGCIDSDLDGVPDGQDNCPYVVNPEQADSDDNGIGDTCQFVPKDTDGDGVDDRLDNCRYAANPDQEDGDGDNAGDACDGLMRSTIEAVLLEMADDDTEGRLCLSGGNALARSRLTARMASLGITPAGENPGSYDQPFYSGVNLIGILEPAGMEGEPPVVMLGAHHDHMGRQGDYACFPHDEADSPICNGATDNAAAVAVVLAAVEALASVIQGPVAVGLWDAEEFGKLGSQYFVQSPTFDMQALRLYINLDVIGANLFIGGEEHTFAIGGESGGEDLLQDVSGAASVSPLKTHLLSTALGQGRSDHERFRGVVPFVFLSDGTGPTYHTTADEIHNVNMDKTLETARIVTALALRALERPAAYPLINVDPDLPVFSDAAPLLEGLELARSLADANGLMLPTRLVIETGTCAVGGILDRGEDLFTELDKITMGLLGLAFLDISMKLPFIPPP